MKFCYPCNKYILIKTIGKDIDCPFGIMGNQYLEQDKEVLVDAYGIVNKNLLSANRDSKITLWLKAPLQAPI